MHRLYGLRGRAYTSKYKQLLLLLRSEIKEDFERIVAEGKFTPKDLGQLCLKYRIPVKIMDEWLPDITERKYPSGTWDRLQDRGCKVKDIGVVWNE